MPNDKSTSLILKEIHDDIKEVKIMQTNQATEIEGLKLWKQAEDAYKAALMQVRADEKFKNDEESSQAWLKILRELYPIVGVLGAILYAVASSKGVH